MQVREKDNIDLLDEHPGSLDLACIEAMAYYKSLGEDPDEIKLKDVYAYLRTKPYPYIATGKDKE